MPVIDSFTTTIERFEETKQRYLKLLVSDFNKSLAKARDKKYVTEILASIEGSNRFFMEDLYYVTIIFKFEQQFRFGEDINIILDSLLFVQNHFLAAESLYQKGVRAREAKAKTLFHRVTRLFKSENPEEIRQIPLVTEYKPGKMYINRVLIRHMAKNEFLEHLKNHQSESEGLVVVPDMPAPKSKSYSKNQQVIAIHYILRHLNLKEGKGNVSQTDIARFIHLLSGIPAPEDDNMDNSNIYKACKSFLKHSEEKNIQDLEFVLEKFKKVAKGSENLSSIVGKIEAEIKDNKRDLRLNI